MSLFGPCLFRACDILVAQPDAWDRYGERATLSFELGLPGWADSQGRNARRAAAPTVFRSDSAAEEKPIL